jgi:hypothetical protein
MNSLSSFAVSDTNPNGITTDGNIIWTGHFTTNSVVAYDLAGNQLFSWSDPGVSGLQGLTYINSSEIAAMDAVSGNINFFNPFTGSFVRSFSAAPLVEGLAYDGGNTLYQLGTNEIVASDVNTGATLFTLANPARPNPTRNTSPSAARASTTSSRSAWTSRAISFVVITGVSGSGKSSLAFDTIFAEGQRKYMESLSAYARQFLDQLQKPDVEQIEGLPPTIAIQQRSGGHNPRSTVATTTEIYDYLRLLFARCGTPTCWHGSERPSANREARHKGDQQPIGAAASRFRRRALRRSLTT